ncbi:MAG: cysteine hydrolase family protein [Candidatus Hodarchaeota archaeon]
MFALLIIDMLNDFIKENSILEVPRGRDIIPNIQQLISKAKEERIPVIYVCDAHEIDDNEFLEFKPHAVKGTEGAEVVEELRPQKGDIIIEKTKFDGFYSTELNRILKELKVNSLIITGVLTDICILYTTASARMREYKTYVVSNGTATHEEETHKRFLDYMANSARIASIVNAREASLLMGE